MEESFTRILVDEEIIGIVIVGVTTRIYGDPFEDMGEYSFTFFPINLKQRKF